MRSVSLNPDPVKVLSSHIANICAQLKPMIFLPILWIFWKNRPILLNGIRSYLEWKEWCGPISFPLFIYRISGSPPSMMWMPLSILNFVTHCRKSYALFSALLDLPSLTVLEVPNLRLRQLNYYPVLQMDYQGHALSNWYQNPFLLCLL